jgi:glycosyltransferase involved in cell wall biosynthesis
MDCPFFTIITPTYNSGLKLRATIDSVLDQRFSSFEYVLIDGASVDCTIDIIRSYHKDCRVRFISEPDSGIYSAMNKGIDLARGRFLYFLGAGDILRPDVLAEIAGVLPSSGMTLAYGSVFWRGRGVVYDGPFTPGKLRRKNICHQAIFYEDEVFRTLGKYETKYAFLSDWAFNMKCFGDRTIEKMYLEKVIADYEGGGLSTSRRDPMFCSDYPWLVREHLGYKQYFLLKSEPYLDRWRRIRGIFRSVNS